MGGIVKGFEEIKGSNGVYKHDAGYVWWARTSVKCVCRETENFTEEFGFLFLLIMNKLTKGAQDKARWCMMFADKVVHETINVLENKFEC